MLCTFGLKSKVHTSSLQEICNNGIDDDGNGLIDAFDPDCNCEAVKDDGTIEVTGGRCGEFVELSVIDVADVTYQWYIDARPISNASGHVVVIDEALEGQEIHVKISDGNTCKLVGPYVLSKGESTVINDTICEGNFYLFGGREITEAGIYQIVKNDNNGCQNNLTLDLRIRSAPMHIITDEFCDGSTYSFYDQEIENEGVYYHTLKTDEVCDSIIMLDLLMEDNLEDSLQVNILPENKYLYRGLEYTQGEYLIKENVQTQTCPKYLRLIVNETQLYNLYIPNVFRLEDNSVNGGFAIYSNFDISVVEILVFDRWGNEVFNKSNFSISSTNSYLWDGVFQGQVLSEGIYTYRLVVRANNLSKESLVGQFLLLE